jgi:hypothetical protein
MRSDEILKKTAEGMKAGNKILIQELVRDLEEKGISPVIAVDGKVRKLKIVGEDEIEDFENELEKFGFDKSDFCFLEEDTTKAMSGKINPITGHVILIHKKSGKLKEYRAGNNSHWVADFHHDLQNKFFTN